MAYTQGHVGRGNFAQIVYAKRMALQGTEKKKTYLYFRVHLTSDRQIRMLVT